MNGEVTRNEMDVLGNSLHHLENIIEIIPTESLPDQEQYPVSFYVNKVTLSIIHSETTLSDEAKHTSFTPALPVLYAYREAMRIILEEGMEKRIQRHRTCSDALYSGLSAIGLSPFADENSRSTVVIALNYLDGLEDKIFRDTLAKKFRILVAGGFGNLKGKVFRVGCMGEVDRYHVMRCISGIASTLAMMGYDTDAQAGLKVAEEKLKPLDSL